MIIRRHYRGCLKENVDAKTKIKHLLNADTEIVKHNIKNNRCLTVALYQYKDMIFLYYEALDEGLLPTELFPMLSKELFLWPSKDGLTEWAFMYPIYYHSIPESIEEWSRTSKKIRRGRIAYLHPDKLFSYVYYHKALVDEGLLDGDQYQSIALHENILFSYFEEPKIFTHIKKDRAEDSKIINDWLAVDPESHFDHALSGESNFLFIDEIFSMGREDVTDETSL